MLLLSMARLRALTNYSGWHSTSAHDADACMRADLRALAKEYDATVYGGAFTRHAAAVCRPASTAAGGVVSVFSSSR